jgi:PAS domain S-box-containing protein
MVTNNDSLLNPHQVKDSAEHKFQSLMNSVNGFEEFTLDQNGYIVSSNLEAVTITGYEEWEVIGRHISIFYGEKEIADGKVSEDLAKASFNGKHISSGFRVKKKGGQFFARMKYTVITDSHAFSGGFKVILYDATHRAMYAVSTRRMKEEYFSLYNNTFIGILRFRLKDHLFTLLNETAHHIIGSSAPRAKVGDLFYYEQEFKSFMDELQHKKKVDAFEFRLNDKDHERYCSISCKSFSYRGAAEGIICDTTEKRNQVNEIKKLSHELDNFIYHASHDMRAPLSSILGLIHLIKTDPLNGNTAEYADRLSERVRYMDSMLRSLSQIAFNNSQPLTSSTIFPHQIMRETLAPFQKQFPEVGCIISGEVINPFHTDVMRLTTILSTVISNAFKYQRSEEPHTVKIEMHGTSDLLEIKVTDNGCGIAPEQLSAIFNAFSKMSTRVRGSGLGLYVAQKMAQKLNGAITVHSELNKGTCFTITVPSLLH